MHPTLPSPVEGEGYKEGDRFTVAYFFPAA